MKIKIGLVCAIIIILQGCSAALVPYTSNPNQKLSYAYSLLNQERILPATNLGKEALKGFSEINNEFGMAESHFFLLNIYKRTAKATNQKFHVKFPDHDPKNGKAILHGKKAIKLFKKLNELTQVSKSQFALANFYLGHNEKVKGCNLYDASSESYKKGVELKPDSGFKILNPNFNTFPDMVASFKLDKCQN